jgi:ergothioneine biosynthesis protein EgtB
MTSRIHAAQAKKISAARLEQSRQITDALFPLLRSGVLYDRPIPERHRLIFYLGHLEAFDWNLIARQHFSWESFHPDFDKLFAFGIDPVDGGLPSDQPADWPREEEVRAYNARVRALLDPLIVETESTLVHVAIEHRLMHAETLAYLIHQLPLDKKMPQHQLRQSAVRIGVPVPRAVDIPAGAATLGQRRHEDLFGWDNEFEECSAVVQRFRADVFPVTNAQFLEFVRGGGYRDKAFWCAEDWSWKEHTQLVHPLFWRRSGDNWNLRTMFADIPLPGDWPVYVSHAEATAFARWAGKQLPTEMQWHRMAYGTSGVEDRRYPWGDSAPTVERGNFNFERWDPEPVQAHPEGSSAFGVADLLGNGWEWTSTPFEPLPGFQPFSFYPGYSANFFDGKHYVMKGGSPRTAACMLRRSFRNWFQPHYPYIYAKFRCVEG